MASTTTRDYIQTGMFTLFRSAALVNGLMLVIICGFILINGVSALSWKFLTEAPRESMTAGGIFPAILGTVLLSVGSMAVAFPLGVAAAIYLSEYARPGRVTRIVRLGINNLAGVPSVVFGLFGLAFFVTYLGFGVSLLSGILTLGVLILPVIIGTAEEALKTVPQTYREASLGLGGTKWQTIWHVVLPAALPGMRKEVEACIGRLPIFGICLGHQLLGQAFGGRTFKLKFGHRGANQPVHDLTTGRIEITGTHVSMQSGAGIVEIDAGGIIDIKGPMVKINT